MSRAKVHPLDLKAPYWICDACAAERGGVPFQSGNTIAVKTCGYCNGKKQVSEWATPVVDFRWPKKERPHGT